MTCDGFTFRQADISDLKRIEDFAADHTTGHLDDYWPQCRVRMEMGDVTVLIAEEREAQNLVGYGLLNWVPKYRVYQQLGVPEIQDLNVLSNYRRRGIATELIMQCEVLARENGKSYMGISFGLTRDFGAAQRLYIALGYQPDGFGVTYDREPVTSGQIRPVDQDLCLMLIKDLA